MENHVTRVNGAGEVETYIFVNDNVHTPNGFASETTIFFTVLQIFAIHGLQ